MLNDPDFRKNLLISVVTSVLVLIFIEPLLRLAANGLMWLGANISSSFTKSVYRSAALGFREKFSFIHLLLFTALVVGGMIGVEVSSLRRRATPMTAASRGDSKLIKVLGPVSALVFFVSLMDLSAVNFIELQLNASFNQRLAVLAAKVPDQKIKELRATWALMQDRGDYEALNKEMTRLANEQGARLPVALWN